MDARLKQKLEDLGRAVSQAISDSTDATRQLSELREEGYAVYLLLESEAAKRARAARQRTPAARGRAQRQLGEREPVAAGLPAEEAAAAAAAPPPSDPTFLIDGRDLAFLRSVGIDPTRSPRRKKAAG